MARRKTDSCLIVFCLICCIAGSKSCSETQCQVLAEGDPTHNFRLKATEEGVRLVYLKFSISNELWYGSYQPLVSKNRILPYRWAWAQSISEPMLSLSYDYDVLSLGLLKNQVRSIVVPLKELQSGCLRGLNSSCQDVAIARALLDVTRDRKNEPTKNRTDVVCVRVLQEYSFGVGGGFKYQCCGEDRLGRNNTAIYCNQSVRESEWLAVFNAILALVVSVVFFYWPLIFCALPDFFFEGDYDGPKSVNRERTTGDQSRGTPFINEPSIRDRKSYEIPVDDLSPITCATIILACAKKLPPLNHGFNVKLFFLWYCVIPIFFYTKVVLYFIIKSSTFDDASRKLIFQFVNFYLYVFSMDRPLVYVLFILPLFIIPGVIFSSWRPSTESAATIKCFLCGKEKCLTSPRKAILIHVQVMPQIISNSLYHSLNVFLDRFNCKCCQNRNINFQHSVCGHSICVLSSVASAAIMGPVLAIITILVFLIVSVACIIAFSPGVCLVIITFRFIRKKKIAKGVLFSALLYSTVSVFIVMIFSCQFVVRMFGFIIMGITLNAEFTIPYITFMFVVGRNLYLCYRNLQNRYKQVKDMMSDVWKKEKKGEIDTIPTELFWFVCDRSVYDSRDLRVCDSGDRSVLPVANEIGLMLWKIISIIIFLCVALAAILLFKVAYNSSAIVSSIAVFLSGKMSEVFFTGVTTGNSFSGWEKIRKDEMIQSVVIDFKQRKEKTGTPRGQDVLDSSPTWYETPI